MANKAISTIDKKVNPSTVPFIMICFQLVVPSIFVVWFISSAYGPISFVMIGVIYSSSRAQSVTLRGKSELLRVDRSAAEIMEQSVPG